MTNEQDGFADLGQSSAEVLAAAGEMAEQISRTREGSIPATPGLPGGLVAFLRARLDEDEQIARDPMAQIWTKAESPSIFVMGGGELVAETGAFADARHIARHDPARVLAEVDAKRRILAEARYWCEAASSATSTDAELRGLTARADVGLRMLHLLALPYADHPDYQPEWAPDA